MTGRRIPADEFRPRATGLGARLAIRHPHVHHTPNALGQSASSSLPGNTPKNTVGQLDEAARATQARRSRTATTTGLPVPTHCSLPTSTPAWPPDSRSASSPTRSADTRGDWTPDPRSRSASVKRRMGDRNSRHRSAEAGSTASRAFVTSGRSPEPAQATETERTPRTPAESDRNRRRSRPDPHHPIVHVSRDRGN